MRQSKSRSELHRQYELEPLELIKSELAMGLAFLDMAATATELQVRQRNRENARKVHDEVVKVLQEGVELTPQQRGDIDAVLATLRDQLEQLT
jgi:hypothetical protein